MTHEILNTIDVQDPNASRSIRNAPWIQSRPTGLTLNPAQITNAIRVARAYCAQTPLTE